MTPLLSGRPLSEFSPTAFKEYVTSLFHKKEPRRPAKKVRPTFSWRRNAKGTLIVSVRRDPKSLTHQEMEQIARESQTPLNELFIHLKKKKISLIPIGE